MVALDGGIPSSTGFGSFVKKPGPGFGHGSVPVLATIPGIPPPPLILME